MEIILRTSVIISIISIFGLFGYGFYLVWHMFNNVQKGRWRIWALFPAAIIDSSLFTEAGNIYRRKLLKVQAALLFLLIMLVIYAKS